MRIYFRRVFELGTHVRFGDLQRGDLSITRIRLLRSDDHLLNELEEIHNSIIEAVALLRQANTFEMDDGEA